MPSQMSSLLSFLTLSLLLNIVVCSNPLATSCSSSANFTATDQFNDNLHQLMFLLATKAPKIGFDIATIGSGQARVDGLALCRGDIPSAACKKCIRTAGAHLRHRCRHSKDSIVWYDNCLLRYSNKEFFGEVDNDHIVFMWNTQSVSKTVGFDQKVAELMKRLVMKAYLTPLLFATGTAKIGEGSEKLYGLAQCTKDLSGGDCKTCLQTAISQLSSCCNGKQGGRVLGGSCNIRYELHHFFDA